MEPAIPNSWRSDKLSNYPEPKYLHNCNRRKEENTLAYLYRNFLILATLLSTFRFATKVPKEALLM